MVLEQNFSNEISFSLFKYFFLFFEFNSLAFLYNSLINEKQVMYNLKKL